MFTDLQDPFKTKSFAMSAKKCKYLYEYIRFGFVCLQKGDTEVPRCVICYKTLSNDGMRPTRLERHLKTIHPALAAKPKYLPTFVEIQ